MFRPNKQKHCKHDPSELNNPSQTVLDIGEACHPPPNPEQSQRSIFELDEGKLKYTALRPAELLASPLPQELETPQSSTYERYSELEECRHRLGQMSSMRASVQDYSHMSTMYVQGSDQQRPLSTEPQQQYTQATSLNNGHVHRYQDLQVDTSFSYYSPSAELTGSTLNHTVPLSTTGDDARYHTSFSKPQSNPLSASYGQTTYPRESSWETTLPHFHAYVNPSTVPFDNYPPPLGWSAPQPPQPMPGPNASPEFSNHIPAPSRTQVQPFSAFQSSNPSAQYPITPAVQTHAFNDASHTGFDSGVAEDRVMQQPARSTDERLSLQCNDCKRIYTGIWAPRTLARHRGHKHGSKPKEYQCPQCAKKFQRSDARKNHVRKQHSTTSPAEGGFGV